MTKDEALKLALEALEMCEAPWTGTLDHNLTEAITAIKQALAAPDLQAELDATNKQVEILSDALAESRREVAALKAVQEPAAWGDAKQSELNDWFLSLPAGRQAVLLEDKWMLAGAAFLAGKTTPPAAQRPDVDALVALARADEREACAKVCDEVNREYDGEEVSASWVAAAIRARGNT
jgi:hypothetical protein